MANFTDEDPHGTGGGDGAGLVGAVIQTGGMLYDNYQNRKTSKENTDKTIAAQKAEAELAYQRQMQMWNAQNMYNSPQAQMQRFIEAGLNPHLIYGQGNPGNSTSTPQYQPANIQYKYAASQPGAAFGAILPTLMAVGSWMQNMRLSEAELRQKQVGAMRGETEIDRARQMIEFLRAKNPMALRKLESENEMIPYSQALQGSLAERAWRINADLEREYQFKWGDTLYDKSGFYHSGLKPGDDYSGMRKLQFLEQSKKNLGRDYENRLLEAKSSWSDFNVTDPQALMTLVLNGIMGMAGQSIRLANRPRATSSHELEEVMRSGRRVIRRRSYSRE